ncbi:unnamed protein product [Adineta steineri]|uniref:Uncharacterized protein n=2 Tax=Adineta steineri TaxID=433720 RepID=A0A814X2C6_9BILA|nr:unnamed protein product [Adineta steineri]CAF3576466.1 unnamed protein product [Adineta steineri]
MRNLIQDLIHQIEPEFKLLNSNKQISSFLSSAKQIIEVKQEETIHSIATIFIIYLIFGWNIHLIGNFIGFLVSFYVVLLAIDLSLTNNDAKWFIYWIVYVLFGFFDYLCDSLHLNLRFFCFAKFIFLIWLVIPHMIYDNILVYYKTIHQFILNYFQPNPKFYNAKAGQCIIDDANLYDQYSNPLDREYDLGRDGAFVGYRILIGQFYKSGDMKAPIEALEIKGFSVKNVKHEIDFISELRSNHYQIAWVISSSSIDSKSFISTLIDFHSNGGAVFLFADNVPYVSHASEFLYKKFGIVLAGDYQGNKTLAFNEDGYFQAGRFGQHEIFTGIKHLFEGVTICHPVYSMSTNRRSITTLATATDGNPCIIAFDPPIGSTEGRLCLDCGFTKLFINWNSAGTARFIVNASCWLARATK